MTTFSAISAQLEGQAIEVPSWAYGNSGTRFKVFGSPGTPRTVQEKIADAAAVHRFTGLAPSVALHIPWDLVDDYAELRAYAEDQGVALGTINSNTFQDDDYMLGSVCHPDRRVRQKAVDHLYECIDIMDATGSGSAPSTPTPSRTMTTSSARSPTPTRPSAERPSSTTSTASR